jgi:secondary thiamine-phosphate synthase enzyme
MMALIDLQSPAHDNRVMFSETITVRAPRRGLHEITSEVERAVARSGVRAGVCNLFIQHTSASLIVQENYERSARVDLENFLDRLVPDGDPSFTHTTEGPDDMPSHIKSALTQVSLTIPVAGGKPALGTWQGIYLWEHRDHPTPRHIVVSVWG